MALAAKRLLTLIETPSYVFLRIVVGLLFAFHGAEKVFGIMGASTPELLSQKGVGGVIELVCGLGVALGLGTRLAAFIASGTMAVAYVQFHWTFAMGDDFFPRKNGGELAVVYAFVFLYISSRGAVALGIDRN